MINYKIGRHNLKDFGIYVSSSFGMLERPNAKEPNKFNWEGYHGEVPDLTNKLYEPRDIVLNCFIKAPNKTAFIKNVREFEDVFDAPGTIRLEVSFDDVPHPLAYEVYKTENIKLNKTWDNGEMVGTFQLSLREPDPVKMLLLHKGTSMCNIGMNSKMMTTIYWGDGSVNYDLMGGVNASHTFDDAGNHYIIIAGNIEGISDLSTNAEVIWKKF